MNSKFIAALNHLRIECMASNPINSLEISREFKISNNFLKACLQLGYISSKKGSKRKYYVWKVGEVIPVMGKAVAELSYEMSKKIREERKSAAEPCDTSIDLQQALKDHQIHRLRRVIDELTIKLKDQKEMYDQDINELTRANEWLASQVDSLRQSEVARPSERKAVSTVQLFGITVYKKLYVKSN